jgi:hypothetical protein
MGDKIVSLIMYRLYSCLDDALYYLIWLPQFHSSLQQSYVSRQTSMEEMYIESYNFDDGTKSTE